MNVEFTSTSYVESISNYVDSYVDKLSAFST